MQLEVNALQAEASSAREAAHAGQAAVLEVDRLAQDNALLAARLNQMNIDLQVLPLGLTSMQSCFEGSPGIPCSAQRS